MPSSPIEILTWLDSYDPAGFYTEDDVETKCVLPLFRLLGYPEQNRRGKYPIILTTGSKGRRHEVDQVYFATADHAAQTVGNTLVIVEAKRASVDDLDSAIAQCQWYSERLRPVLLVVMNGVRLVALRRRRFDPDEIVLDGEIAALADLQAAQELVEILGYERVLALHQRLINELAYEQYVRLEQALQAHPDIQAILGQGDFAASEEREGRSLRVTRAKVQIDGELPLCLGGGSCEITFSHILRRGLRLHLDHAAILRTLMVGIDSDLAWDTRRFIERESEDSYRIRVGDMETQISSQEAQDLCACVDRFAGAYRDVLMDAEDALESWEFPLSSWHGDPAFYLTSAKASFWEQLRQFADQNEWQRGEIDRGWRIFERWAPGIRIGHERGDHAWIVPTQPLDGMLITEPDLVHLRYVLRDGLPPPDHDVMRDIENWKLHLGSNGPWSVGQTYQWLSSKLFPEIERRHPFQLKRGTFGQFRQTVNGQPYPASGPVENTKQLVPYIEDIQRWLTMAPTRLIQSSLIAPAYEHLLDLARGAEASVVSQHYVTSNMFKATADLDLPNATAPEELIRDYFARGEAIRDYLLRTPTVSPRLLDYVMRSLFGLYEDATVATSQSALNRTWAAIRPLWRLAQFEQRHVWPCLERHG
ncbi:hypothetical protein K2Z83_23825 [Oscillochloris sp. ZM17-4]|uniref:hypothetical protein n=1 Tax=Oscillochloris sp. ZM17-4 TaxID=2866714 RepID=UPI001C7336B2|nr:hypothetical protein [Oscillochloris sp. ZM17-4]MBX0330690.1 hypothetical protein [Oscillochloris sp. ZM17-4]